MDNQHEEHPDGGVAFPSDYDNRIVGQHEGMTLRDYFAGQAISSIPNRAWDHIEGAEKRFAAWANAAYKTADAMIAARGKK